MNIIPDTIKKELDLEKCTPEQQQQLVAELEDLVEHRVTAELLDELDTESAEKLKKLMESGSDEEVSAYFEQLVSKNKQVVARAITKTVQEFKQVSKTIGLS
ncbi:MAG: hypothetical protein WDZ82_00995 [Candidatus Paceibacterota bacterium]